LCVSVVQGFKHTREIRALASHFSKPWDFSAISRRWFQSAEVYFWFEMGKAVFFFFSGVLLVCVLSTALIEPVAGSEMDAFEALWVSKPRPRCEGSIGECFEDEEMQMDSEINRRFLAGRTYVSYGALRSNSVPCSRRGSSYYNCGSTSQANPYKRSCTQITRCARSTS
jgi:hypothetical protein